MPFIDAVIITRWAEDAGVWSPDAVNDIFAWALANDEYLPGGRSKVGPFGRYEDLTGQVDVRQQILDDLAVFVAKLEVTPATAQHFADDPRIFTLGYWQRDDEGNAMDDNWDTALTVEERQRAVNYITSNSKITAQQLANVFDATDTRKEIARKLKEFFR